MTFLKWQCLDWSCHSVFTKAIHPHRITRSHFKLSKVPLLAAPSSETPSPLSTVFTRLHCWLPRAGPPGSAPCLDHSWGKKVCTAGSHVELVWASSSQKTPPGSHKACGKSKHDAKLWWRFLGHTQLPWKMCLAQPCHSTSWRCCCFLGGAGRYGAAQGSETWIRSPLPT